MVVKCQNLVKVYQASEAFRALNGVSLHIREGEFVSIMGPSGCGKSTLLNILGLLDEPTEGEYFLNGIPTAKMNDTLRSKTRSGHVGFIFQSFNLMPRLSVLENIALPMRYTNIPRPDILLRARELAERVGLKNKIKNTPLQLSGGQCQRVACARALANRPSLILADEPTGNLDSKASADILSLLQELNQNGMTIIMVTHDPQIAQSTHRIIHMQDGSIL